MLQIGFIQLIRAPQQLSVHHFTRRNLAPAQYKSGVGASPKLSIGCIHGAIEIRNQVKIASYYYLPETIEQLKRLSDATRISQAAYLREALDDLLKKYAATLRKVKG